MIEYTYSRELVDGDYNINNPARLDEFGNQIRITSEIEAALPGLFFKVKCSGENVTISFNDPLTEEQHDLLDTVVSNHKNNL